MTSMTVMTTDDQHTTSTGRHMTSNQETAPVTAPKPLNPSASVPAFFGAELRRLRLIADMTQDELGSKILYTSSLVGLVEAARRTPTRDFAERCDATLDADGHLLRVWDLLTHARWPDPTKQLSDREACATVVRCVETTLIPRLLQTPEYARAALAARGDCRAPEDLDAAVDASLARRRVLDTASCWFAIDEAVLRRRVGGPDVMRAQLLHLIEAAAVPGTVLQVVPFSVEEYPGLHGPFTLLSADDAPDVACLDGHTTILIDNPDTVARCGNAFDLIRATAPSPRQSLAAIRGVLDAL